MKNKIIAIILLLILFCSGCKKKSSNTGFVITDSYGREILISEKPQRIVSLAPSISETIAALGELELLVGRTDYCDFPAEIAGIAAIGSLMNPNIEKIVELNPDLVIASTHFTKESLEKLENLSIKTIILQAEKSFEGVYSIITNLGKIVDQNKAAQNIIKDMKKRVAIINKKVQATSSRPKVYYVIGYGKGDYTAGGDTFIHRLIEMAGGTNIAGDISGWRYSLEKIIEKDPDYIFCSKYYQVKEGLQTTNGYKDLRAVQNNQLYAIDNNLLDRQSPRLIEGLEEMVKILHPELF
ncbi:MAG: ABC transporter substrate-binding protein [Spirochaetes bacterium]|nr:ABC transporter substrate-binding protein [Spirochaetota bacterium]